MIKQAIELLHTNEFKGVSEEVEIAKGKYYLSDDYGHHWRMFKRWFAMKRKSKKLNKNV